jgi:hypothetical protein
MCMLHPVKNLLRTALIIACAGFPFHAVIANDGLESRARWLASQGIPYAGSWVPPGETSPWQMDCSNTIRWLHREERGEILPRTSSAQYEHFRQRGQLRRIKPDLQRLRSELRRGDLLFWEHTYKPKRNPPVTHVMLYLGRDASGKMWMAGSQGKRGVSIHEFRPKQKLGGYNWFLWFRRDGRFVGYARP